MRMKENLKSVQRSMIGKLTSLKSLNQLKDLFRKKDIGKWKGLLYS